MCAYVHHRLDSYVSAEQRGYVHIRKYQHVRLKQQGRFEQYLCQRAWRLHDEYCSLGYSFTKEPDDDKSSTNTSLFVINPGVNYYLPIVENKFFYTPGLDLGIGFGAQNYIDDTSKEKLFGVTNFYISLSLLSFEYRPVHNFGISFRAGDLTYSLMQYKQTVGDETMKVSNNNFNFGLNLSTSLGFRYYF